MMKVSKLRTLWIIVLSILATGVICSKAIFKRLSGTINRPWVDKTTRAWVDHILALVQTTCRVVNPHQVAPQKGRPTIIMSNHSSLYDIPLSLKAFPDTSIRMLAKKELAKIPLMGKAMKAAEFPFIDRKNRRQAIKDLQYVQDLLNSGVVMWIAPEGTRSKDGKLSTFKKGAFITAIQAHATIIPIGIRGAYQILPARTFQLNVGQEAQVHIGQPIEASEYSLENKEELIERVHSAMQELVGESL